MGDPRKLAPLRRRDAALAGHAADIEAARRALADADARVRSAALGAVARAGALTADDIGAALADEDPTVRRRACEVAAPAGLGGDEVLLAVDDADPAVAEAAAWCLGELAERGGLPESAVTKLAAIAIGHDDALVREAAVASLGAIGDPDGLPAILAATHDKPAVRRRAVLALAPFDGEDVDTALHAALEDRDWQVRDAAELLLRAERDDS